MGGGRALPRENYATGVEKEVTGNGPLEVAAMLRELHIQTLTLANVATWTSFVRRTDHGAAHCLVELNRGQQLRVA